MFVDSVWMKSRNILIECYVVLVMNEDDKGSNSMMLTSKKWRHKKSTLDLMPCHSQGMFRSTENEKDGIIQWHWSKQSQLLYFNEEKMLKPGFFGFWNPFSSSFAVIKKQSWFIYINTIDTTSICLCLVTWFFS